jgi:hypothetical protein
VVDILSFSQLYNGIEGIKEDVLDLSHPRLGGYDSGSAAEYVRELGKACLGDRDGLLVMIRIYIDETGTHDDSPVVAVGAYAGRLETWPAFIEDWSRAKAPINVFHSADCQALEGEFKGWTEKNRDALVARLLAVPARYELYGIAMGINLRDLADAVAADADIADNPYLGAFFGVPYGMSLIWVLLNIIERTEDAGIRHEPLALFHEQNDFHADAMKAFEFVKSRRKRHVGPMTITFCGKDEFVPLQAADVLAYEANKRLRDPSKPQRRSIAALGENITVEGFAKPNIHRIISGLKAFAERRRREGGRDVEG